MGHSYPYPYKKNVYLKGIKFRGYLFSEISQKFKEFNFADSSMIRDFVGTDFRGNKSLENFADQIFYKILKRKKHE